MFEDLALEPHVVVRDAITFDVVFEGRPRAWWKDWLVALSMELRETLSDVTFECFYDLVGDRCFPGSLNPNSKRTWRRP